MKRAFILAAGLGTRMRPLTLYTPKPLLLAKNKPLIEYHLEKCAEAGITEVMINISHLAPQIEKALGNGERWQLKIHYSKEEMPLETAGGIAKALAFFENEPFLCMNADIWTDYPLQKIMAQSKKLPQDFSAYLVMVANPAHHLQGDFSISSTDNKTLQVVRPKAEKNFTFSGLSILNPTLFTGLNEEAGKLAPYLIQAMADNKVYGEIYNGHWFDVGTVERLNQLDAFLRQS